MINFRYAFVCCFEKETKCSLTFCNKAFKLKAIVTYLIRSSWIYMTDQPMKTISQGLRINEKEMEIQ